MNDLSVIIGASLAVGGLSPALVWSTVLVWTAVAFVLAAVVAVAAGQGRPQAREQRARLFWTGRVPLQACALCAR